MQKGFRPLVAGLFFSFLWSSAATATKIGLQAVQPFTICVVRFFSAGTIMILLSRFVLRQRLPRGREWRAIALYGVLSNSVYLGLYVLAMRQVSAGLGSLSVAMNPLLINLMTALLLRRRLPVLTLVCLVICMAGVMLAAWPLLQNSTATPAGLLILLSGLVAYSAGVVYFSRVEWNGLPLLAINGWQVLLGGVFLLPLAAAVYRPSLNHWGMKALGAIGWLAIPVSIGAVQLWLYLLKRDAARSSFWLFLTPVFGFVISNVFTGEPITGYTIVGMLLVIGGIYWPNRSVAGR
ncbi:MAG TPA: EamA family transporter [Puia sp.]|uniref:DMT family transporter n=1 Tax=Puia sp. TaxID=2045100 RepID=UPI002BDA8937|nr:EamA family transporter [Puia sp.]HVU99635.1 EamA family transporter [Puia sp.]